MVAVEGRQHDHLRRVGLLAQPPGRLEPALTPHPQVHQHDVDRGRAGAARDLVTVAGLPHDRDLASPVEHHRQSFADQRVVVDQEHPDRAHAGHGSCASISKVSRPRRWSSSPPTSRTRSVRPTRPWPPESARGDAPAMELRTRTVQPITRAAGERDPDRMTGRVLAGVGQPFLHHPVGGPSDRRRAVDGRDLVLQGDRPACRPGLVHERGHVGEHGQRRGVVVLVVAEHGDDLAQLHQCVVHSLADDTCGAGALLGEASGRYSSAPAYVASSESRCASTSCISRARAARSPARASATRRSCSASARRARSAREATSAAWERIEGCPARGLRRPRYDQHRPPGVRQALGPPEPPDEVGAHRQQCHCCRGT